MNRFVLAGLAIALLTTACDNPSLVEPAAPVLEWNSESLTYSTDVGVNVLVEADIAASEGLDKIEVELPAWSADETSESDVIEITGSPRNYQLKYEVVVSDKATVGQHIVKFNVCDYAGKNLLKEVTVNVQGDKVAPELTVVSPETGVEVSPEGIVVFEVVATDDLKMKDVVLSCPTLAYQQVFVPESNSKTVEVKHEYKMCAEYGEYEFIIKATDDQLNSVEQKVVVKVCLSSKPRIERVGTNPLCGVSGGTIPFRFKIQSNDSHPLTSVVIKCPAISLEETVVPDGWSYDLAIDSDVAAATPAQFDLEYTVTAVNDKAESTEYKGTLNIFDKVYAIGTGTMAKEKDGYALPMTQSQTNPNEFEFTTWINVVGEGVKFLSAPSWSGFNWGLDANGSVVSPESDFIRTESTGYHKFTFNPTTWEYKVEPLTVTNAPETEELWLYGQFNQWDEDAQQWAWRDWWFIPFKRHPENPHCFYIDVKTGSEGTNVILWKVAGQNAIEGLAYGFNAPGMEIYGGELWDYHWWENIAPYYKYDSLAKVPYYREDGRKDAVMRLMVDIYTGYMSWMSLKEQVDAGWTIYPPMYTPAE